MKIAIISDSHDNLINLTKAVELANAQNCEYLFHAGDLVAPPMIPALGAFKGKVMIVWGNNEMEKLGLQAMIGKFSNIQPAADFVETEVDGIKIFMNHFPKFAELAAKSGDYDLVIYGHTHLAEEKQINNTKVVNPGEIHGYKTGKPGFMIFDTQTKSIETVLLP